jgi:hypothetical protein
MVAITLNRVVDMTLEWEKRLKLGETRRRLRSEVWLPSGGSGKKMSYRRCLKRLCFVSQKTSLLVVVVFVRFLLALALALALALTIAIASFHQA